MGLTLRLSSANRRSGHSGPHRVDCGSSAAIQRLVGLVVSLPSRARVHGAKDRSRPDGTRCRMAAVAFGTDQVSVGMGRPLVQLGRAGCGKTCRR
jgi:hypothetical protein